MSATLDDDTVDDVIEGLEISSIYDDDMVEKYVDDKGSNRWRCKWCNMTFAGWNATKALHHVNKVSGKDIKPCRARIDKERAMIYAEFQKKTETKRNKKVETATAIERSIVSHNNTAAESLQKRRRSSTNSTPSKSSRLKQNIDTGDTLSSVTMFTPHGSPSSNKKQKLYIQTTVHDGGNSTFDNNLTMAIADLIHSCGLPFRLCSEPKFRKVLQLSRLSGTKFTPPSRNSVAGELLDLNYDEYLKKNMLSLMKEVDIFGLTFYGDGATVRKMPLINVLASSAHLPVTVLEIVDCTKHIEGGGRKDARYIASLFRPHMDRIESTYPNSSDVIFFDGASNVQKAGQVLEVKYPRCYVLHGAEHVVSLFFQDIFSLPEFKALTSIIRRTYNVFGNGSMHSPYAIFQKYSKRMNGGNNIGLIRAAGTRMAGVAIAMQRFLRLKEALNKTVTSSEFTKLKVSMYILKTYYKQSHLTIILFS